MAFVCVVCGHPLADKQRAHAKTCSAPCRRAQSRRSRRALKVVEGQEVPAGIADRAELLRRLDEQRAPARPGRPSCC
jgi:hypothetical protein